MKRLAVATLALLFAFSPPAFAASTLKGSDYLLAEARAGVITMFILETVDNPTVLASPKTQSFIDQAFRLYHALAPKMNETEMTNMREELRGKNQPHDQPILKKLLTFEGHMVATKSPDRQQAWMLGSRSMQLQYNAESFKNHAAARLFLNQLAQMDVLDSLLPPMHDLRLSLVSVKAFNPQQDDWEREAIASHAISTLILRAGSPPMPPIAGLIVGRPVGSDGPAAQHLLTHIEFIYGDGRIKTMSSYTDGTPTMPHGVIHCGIDKLPYQPAIFAIPLTLPVIGKTAAQASFQNLAQACANFEATKPHLTYQPPNQTPDTVIPQLLQVTDTTDGQFFLKFAQKWQQPPHSATGRSR